MHRLTLPCPRCGGEAPVRLAWRQGRGVLHLGAWCSSCGAWIKWLPQTPPLLRLAPPKPPVQGGLFEEVAHG